MRRSARGTVPFVIALIVLAASPASAATEWSHQSSPNPGNYINLLESVSTISSTDAWADGVYLDVHGGDCRTLIEHYAGTKWSHVASPNPGTANDYLYGIKMTSSTNAWAVGTYGTSSASKTLVLRYDGSAWAQQSSPSPNSALNALFGIAGGSDTNAWAVGSQGTASPAEDCSQYAGPRFLRASPVVPAAGAVNTLIEHYDGSSWSTVAGVNPGTCVNVLEGASTTSLTDAWAAGFFASGGCSVSAYKTLVEHYDGSKWARIATPNPGPHGNLLYGISANDPSDIWAAGTELNAQGYAANGLILHYNGTGWKAYKVLKGVTSALYAIKATSSTNVWTVGAYTTSTGEELPLILHYDGTKWSAQTAKQLSGASALYGVGATGTGNAFTVGVCAGCGGKYNGTLVYHHA